LRGLKPITAFLGWVAVVGHYIKGGNMYDVGLTL